MFRPFVKKTYLFPRSFGPGYLPNLHIHYDKTEIVTEVVMKITSILAVLLVSVPSFAQIPTMPWQQQLETTISRSVQKENVCAQDAKMGKYIAQRPQAGGVFFVSRDANDPRILRFLGEDYRAYLGESALVNYFPKQHKDDAGFAISAETNTTVKTKAYKTLDFFSEEGYTSISQDFRNPNDFMASFSKSTKTGINYKVVRVFIKKNTVYMVVFGKTFCNKNLPLRRTVFKSIQQTPQEVFPYSFGKELCIFGEDCYD